jgi:CBS domain-containing protein
MQIEEIMSSHPECCRSDEFLDDAVRKMWDRDCGFVPVVDEEGSVIGILTDRDVALAACEQDKRLSEIPVGSAMSLNVCWCSPEDDVDDVEELMRRAQVRRLPVADASRRIVGIISLNDLALASRGDAISATHVASTLAEICEHAH